MKNFLKLISTITLFSFVITQNYGQAFATATGNVLLKEQKYKSYENDLFLFKSFQKGDLIDQNGNIIENVDVNFNRMLSLFVGLYQGKQLLLNEYRYRKVIVHDNDQGKITFANNIDSENPEKYFQVLFSNQDFQLLKEYSAKLIESGGFNYGKSSDTDYIKKSEDYFFIIDGKLDKIKLKEKDILKPFKDQKRAIKKIAKDGNLSFENETDVVTILSRFEEIN